MASREASLMLPSSERVMPFLLALGFAVAGVVLGYVVATGKPLLIAVSIGAIFGILLLNALHVAVWTVLIGTLLVSGPLFMFVPTISKTGWLFSILGFFLTGAAMLYPALGKRQPTGTTPRFVYLAVIFVVWSIGLSVFSAGALPEIIGGIKKYFQFWGLLFALAVVPFERKMVWRWIAFLGFLAMLQLPLAAYQRFMLVPYLTVANAEIIGFVAIDIVVGTFEGALQGGGSSSVMALFLVLVLVYLLSARRDGVLVGSRFWLMFILAAVPLGLGETKIVIVLLPLALAMAYMDLVAKRPGMFLFGAILTLFFAMGFVYIYAVIQAPDAREMSFEQRISEIIAYNFGKDGYMGGTGLNRLTVLTFWFQEHGWHDPIGTFFGHGLGSSYGGDGRVPLTGHVNNMYPNKLIGQTSAASILWDMGVTGFVIYLGMLLGAWQCARRLVAQARPGPERALCRTLLASAACIPVMTFYWDGITVVPSQQTAAMLTLGLIAWCARGPIAAVPGPRATAPAR